MENCLKTMQEFIRFHIPLPLFYRLFLPLFWVLSEGKDRSTEPLSRFHVSRA
jgi:hypothetical protein